MPDIADQMAVLLAGRRPVLHAITVGRLTGTFDDRERDRCVAVGLGEVRAAPRVPDYPEVSRSRLAG